jgi:uncharacterized protein YegJ (DUF2314 family)
MQVIEDEIVPVASENAAMSDAIDQARASIRQFFAAYRLPKPNMTDFHLKAVFSDGDEREHIWLSDLDFNTRPATGVVSNKPGIRTVVYRQRVSFTPDQITDWMYRQNGRLVGGFTTRVLLQTKEQEGGFLSLLKRRFIN